MVTPIPFSATGDVAQKLRIVTGWRIAVTNAPATVGIYVMCSPGVADGLPIFEGTLPAGSLLGEDYANEVVAARNSNEGIRVEISGPGSVTGEIRGK